MKKIINNILIAVALFTASMASAQAPEIDTSRPTHLITLGAHIGDGMCTVRQNYAKQLNSVSNFTLTPGNTFLAGATARLNIRSWFAIGTGLDFTINNYHYDITMLDTSGAGTLGTLNAANRYYALEVPAYVQFAVNLAGPQVQWVNQLGAYYLMGFGGHTNTTTYRSSTNQLGQSQVTADRYEGPYFNDDNGIINKIESTDYGLHLATGFLFHGHYTVDAVFHVGLRNLAKNFGVYDTKLRNMVLTARIGYLF